MNGMNAFAQGGGNDRLFDKIERLEAEVKQLKEQLSVEHSFISQDRSVNRIKSALDLFVKYDNNLVNVVADTDNLVFEFSDEVQFDQFTIDALNSIGCHNQTSKRCWELSL